MQDFFGCNECERHCSSLMKEHFLGKGRECDVAML